MIGKQSAEDERFCGYTEGIAAGTNVDNHGDKLTLENPQKMKDDIYNNTEKRVVNLEHNEKDKIGEIVNCEIENIGSHHFLKVKVGIYKGREDVIEKIQKGELKGFSISFRYEVNVPNSLKQILPPLNIEIDAILRKDLEDLLTANNISYSCFVRKADTATSIITIAGFAASIIEILKIVYDLRKDKKSNINVYNIKINDSVININTTTQEETGKRIREESLK